jgi:hypothetical protein
MNFTGTEGDQQMSTVWMADSYGNKALVDKSETDTWAPHGWREAEEPTADDRVWLRHEETGGRQLFPASVVAVWGALGWKPSAPESPLDLLHDQRLVDAPREEPPDAKKATKATKTAASEKE